MRNVITKNGIAQKMETTKHVVLGYRNGIIKIPLDKAPRYSYTELPPTAMMGKSDFLEYLQ